MEPAHLPNNTTFLLSKPWKFQFISCSGSKVIPFLPSDRQTDTQTHILHPYMHGQDFFYMEIYTFHYNTLLTHFVCEGLPSKTKEHANYISSFTDLKAVDENVVQDDVVKIDKLNVTTCQLLRHQIQVWLCALIWISQLISNDIFVVTFLAL